MATNKRRLEMIEGSSSKFWEVSVEGASFTVTFGRIGTAGLSKTTDCESPAAAQAGADKLVREKLKKGYHEPGGVAAWRPPEHVGTYHHIDRFLNYKVTGYNPHVDPDDDDDGEQRLELPALRELDKRVFAISIDPYEDREEEFAARLEALLADERVGDLRGLVVGIWFSEICQGPPIALFDALVPAAPKLRSLRGLFVGDIIQEECEISWLQQTDYAPLLHALPGLEVLVVRGGEGLRLRGLAHGSLRSLTLQTGGLPAAAVRDVVGAQLPALRELTLWLGSDSYGGDSTIADLAPLFEGTCFPALEHLGLQDSEYSDDIAVAIASSPLLARLKGLDLSMGTLSDAGAQALLDSPHIRGLRHLNLRHHYLSPAMVKKIRALGIEVNTNDARLEEEPDEESRYVEVAE
jgi:predicted DNA-binding WGR domain protein